MHHSSHSSQCSGISLIQTCSREDSLGSPPLVRYCLGSRVDSLGSPPLVRYCLGSRVDSLGSAPLVCYCLGSRVDSLGSPPLVRYCLGSPPLVRYCLGSRVDSLGSLPLVRYCLGSRVDSLGSPPLVRYCLGSRVDSLGSAPLVSYYLGSRVDSLGSTPPVRYCLGSREDSLGSPPLDRCCRSCPSVPQTLPIYSSCYRPYPGCGGWETQDRMGGGPSAIREASVWQAQRGSSTGQAAAHQGASTGWCYSLGSTRGVSSTGWQYRGAAWAGQQEVSVGEYYKGGTLVWGGGLYIAPLALTLPAR